MKKAFASDFDGTLYFMFDEEPIRKDDIIAIEDFREKGNLFGVCTGRSLRGITDVIENEMFDFYILASGALIVDQDLNIISQTCISYQTMKEIYEKYEKDLDIIIQANDTVYCLQEERPLQVFIRSIEEMENAAVYGLSFGTNSPDQAKMIADEINESYGDEIIAFANVKNVDIVSKECSKGKALEIVKNYYEIDLMAGIGDSFNDIPMLEKADCTYTFPYAPGEVQKKVDQIVNTVSEAIEIYRR